ncbi:Neogenin [Trichinella pseudospiralis]
MHNQRLIIILIAILIGHTHGNIDENQPPGIPTNVQFEVLSQDTIYLWWNPPADSDQIVVRGYTVGWGIGDSIDSMAISLSGKDSTSVKLDNLLPNTNYTISLSAFNDKGDGKQEKKVICTKPDNPDLISTIKLIADYLLSPVVVSCFVADCQDPVDYLKPPINLHAEAWSSTEILLTWDDFPCERCPDFGQANYLVRYAPHNDEHATVKTATVNERQVLLSDLIPDTEYEFSIKTRNQYANSEWSTLTFGKTLPKAYPQKQTVPTISAANEMLRTVYVDRDQGSNLPATLSEHLQQIDNEDSPTIVRLLASHPNLLHIEWERPLRLQRTITGYDIFYKLLFDDADVNGGWLKKTVYGNLESYDLDVSYNRLGDAPVDSIQVKIRALTSSGPGKFSDVATHDFDIFTRVGYLKSDAKKEAEMEIRRSVKVVVENEKDVLKVNEIFVASCVIETNYQRSQRRWYFPNETVVPFDTGIERAYVSFWKNHTILRLVIENVQPEDSGTYICGKKHRNKLYGQSVHLTVKPLYVKQPSDNGFKPIVCKFEKLNQSEFCQWKVETESANSWHLAYIDPYAPNLGVTNGHELNRQQVMLFEGDSTIARTIGRLISPVLPSDFSFHYCFNFAYRIRPESNGKIFIYALPQPEQFDNQVLLMHFKLSLAHGQEHHHWQNCAIKLLPIKHNFRIAIEVIKSAGEKVFIAIDSLQLMPGICKSACNQPSPAANHRHLHSIHQPLQYSSIKGPLARFIAAYLPQQYLEMMVMVVVVVVVGLLQRMDFIGRMCRLSFWQMKWSNDHAEQKEGKEAKQDVDREKQLPPGLFLVTQPH